MFNDYTKSERFQIERLLECTQEALAHNDYIKAYDCLMDAVSLCCVHEIDDYDMLLDELYEVVEERIDDCPVGSKAEARIMINRLDMEYWTLEPYEKVFQGFEFFDKMVELLTEHNLISEFTRVDENGYRVNIAQDIWHDMTYHRENMYDLLGQCQHDTWY